MFFEYDKYSKGNDAMNADDPAEAVFTHDLHNTAKPADKQFKPSTETINSLLKLFTTCFTRKQYLDSVVDLLRDWSGCDCVGVRILDGSGNLPYESYAGFSREFWEAENWLLIKNPDCACIRVALDEPEPQDMPLMTSKGSFYSCNMRDFANSLSRDEQARFRGKCAKDGFLTVIIIPVRYNEKIFGTIHLADKKECALNLQDVEFIESVAPVLGEMINRFNREDAHKVEQKLAQEELRGAYAQLEQRVAERTGELAHSISKLKEEISVRRVAEKELRNSKKQILRLNRLYAVLSSVNQIIVQNNSRDAVFDEICRAAVKHGGFRLARVALLDKETGQINAAAACGEIGYLENIRLSIKQKPEATGPTGIAIRDGSHFICNDFQGAAICRPWHEQAHAHGLCASASIALKQDNEVVGALTLYAGEKNFFDSRQEELLLQLGMDISFALENLDREERRRRVERALREETLERLRAIETLREQEQILLQQSRMAALGEMIGNIAHQWRQPLNTLGLIAQQMQVFYKHGEFSKEYLDTSVKNMIGLIRHMSQTIDDFSNYFQPDKEIVEFKVQVAIDKTYSLVESSLKNQQIKTEVDIMGEPVIKGFPNEFSQVLLNIMLNAKDALLEKAVVNPKVTVRAYCENNRAIVTIADNAGGIPQKILNKIFDPYFTTKAPNKGTGVGLFMSKGIIERMNGTLTARNIGEGAEFKITV